MQTIRFSPCDRENSRGASKVDYVYCFMEPTKRVDSDPFVGQSAQIRTFGDVLKQREQPSDTHESK